MDQLIMNTTSRTDINVSENGNLKVYSTQKLKK